MEFIKEKTCAVTGHRKLGGDFNEIKTEKIFKSLIKKGYNTFLIGMALGFDTSCFFILDNLKKEYKDIKLIACIPCESQAEKFTEKQKEIYSVMLNKADEKIFVSKEYNRTCMMKRNIFMVDNASVLVAYLSKNKSKGGSYNTVNYALKKNVAILNVAVL